MIENVIVKHCGKRWKIRNAINFKCARDAIVNATIKGNVGSTIVCQGIMIADVVRVNAMGQEEQPK